LESCILTSSIYYAIFYIYYTKNDFKSDQEKPKLYYRSTCLSVCLQLSQLNSTQLNSKTPTTRTIISGSLLASRLPTPTRATIVTRLNSTVDNVSTELKPDRASMAHGCLRELCSFGLEVVMRDLAWRLWCLVVEWKWGWCCWSLGRVGLSIYAWWIHLSVIKRTRRKLQSLERKLQRHCFIFDPNKACS
jgi:hypothetical protein